MSESRRTFLKAAGLTAVGGASITVGGWRLARAEDHELAEMAESGSRWAMAIDIGRCASEGQGCTRCIDACHRMHNVPNFVDNPRLQSDSPILGNNPRHEIKWAWRANFRNAFPEQFNPHEGGEGEGEHGGFPSYLMEALEHLSVPVMCNHCDNAPCVRVCPTQATWQREDGIVMMDMHRCIGCRFCVVGCPYGSRSFNFRDPRPAFTEPGSDRVVVPNPDYPTRMQGVVEKCNFCSELPEDDRTPHCARACPAHALIFGDLSDEDSEVRTVLRENFTIRRKPSLGTRPHVFYVVGNIGSAGGGAAHREG